MKVFVLTGAGVSAESGLGTFRDKGGLWAARDPAALATPEAFARDPDAVQAFYNARRASVLQAQPNAAHVALARLEAGLAAQGGVLTLVTQNVDDLHERAGSRQVVHMHGELLKARWAGVAVFVVLLLFFTWYVLHFVEARSADLGPGAGAAAVAMVSSSPLSK